MFNLFNKPSPPIQEAETCHLVIAEAGLNVTGPQEQPNTQTRPKTLAEALWQSRSQLVESGLATALLMDDTDANESPCEDWASLHVPFDSLTWLKEGYANPQSDEPMPDVFDAILSDLLPALTEWTLKIEPDTNVLVSSDLQLELSFWQTGQAMHPRRTGPWLVAYGQPTLLNEMQWNLCQLAEQFNARTDKNAETNFSTLAQLYEQLGLEHPTNVRLEAILEDTVILAPSRITMSWQSDSDRPNATQSAYPVFLNLPIEGGDATEQLEEAFRKEFFKYDKAQPTYSLPALALTSQDQPKKIRILLPPALQDAATHMRQSMRGLSKSSAQSMALSPERQFEGVCPPDALALDLSTYGPRVIGLGPLVFRPVLKVRTLDRVCLLEDGWDRLTADEQPSSPTVLDFEAQTGAGDTVKLTFPRDPETLETISQQMHTAIENQESLITLTDATGNECTFAPTPKLASQFQQAAGSARVAYSKATASSLPHESNASHNRHLSALSNEDQQLYNELAKYKQDDRSMLERFARPSALVETMPDGNPLTLGQYQQEGIAWLQTAFLSGKPGVLLADDMGLGKTLQVLTFLAWLLEEGWSNWHDNAPNGHWVKQPISNTIQPGQQHIVNPHPILVVVPKMLMDNWESEIGKFFEKNGDLFSNFELLDNKRIKDYALPNLKKGNDFKTGEPSLNLQLLQSNRLLIANYDTVKNYYQSFAKIPWSCLVMDESQEIKNPGTAVTHAMSCIASNVRFKITMTGTPIENDLMDLWTLFDVTAPGLLGSAKDFKKRFYLGEESTTTHGWEIDPLKDTLGCKTSLKEAQASSYVLGRNKTDVLAGELPVLVDVSRVESTGNWPVNVEPLPISCRFQYTALEWQQQKEILEEIARESKRGKALKAVQYIKSFSEHPWLATRAEDPRERVYDSANLLANSSKFRWLLETLQHVHQRKEKVLIFTRSVQMQTWIYNLLKERFNIDYEPINGAISSKKEGGSSRTTAILKRFQAHQGFAALVLSPEVAGVGLNITAANHVIHYGRWWNPAKEDQATCRAYRKGQSRSVYLYVPIGAGPENQESFDERLDSMLRAKSDMRQDFLTPTGGLDLSPEDTQVLIPGFEVPTRATAQAEGHEFETMVAQWMKTQGFEQVTVTPGSNDWGADVLAVKENRFYIVQCKRQLQADAEIIQALNQAKTYYGNNELHATFAQGRKMIAVVASRYNVSNTVKAFFENKSIEVWSKNWN